MGTADDTGRTDQRIDLSTGQLAHQLAQQHAACGTEGKCHKTQNYDLDSLSRFRKASALVVAPTEVPRRITTIYISALDAVSVS